MNATVALLHLSLIASNSPMFSIHALSKHQKLSLNRNVFSRFSSNVLKVHLQSQISLTVFDTLFHKAKALSMKDEVKCVNSVGVSMKHQELSKVCINFKKCTFESCISYEHGGACDLSYSNVTFAFCAFRKCSAQHAGSVWSSQSKIFQMNETSITETHAERFGALYSDSRKKNLTTLISSTNVTHSSSDLYISAIRVEETLPVFTNVMICHAHSKQYGAIWDWSTRPNVARYTGCSLINTTSESEGAGMTMYHWMHQSVIEKCYFSKGQGKSPVYIYIFSSESTVEVKDSWFDMDKDSAIGQRFPNNTLLVHNSTTFSATKAPIKNA